MDAWAVTAAIFTSVLVVLNGYIAWHAIRVLRWLYKSRKMANALWSLYKSTEAWLIFALAIIAVVIIALMPMPERAKTVAFYLIWTPVTIFVALSLRRVDRMLTDRRTDPAAPVK